MDMMHTATVNALREVIRAVAGRKGTTTAQANACAKCAIAIRINMPYAVREMLLAEWRQSEIAMWMLEAADDAKLIVPNFTTPCDTMGVEVKP